jgi:hypothetical protein
MINSLDPLAEKEAKKYRNHPEKPHKLRDPAQIGYGSQIRITPLSEKPEKPLQSIINANRLFTLKHGDLVKVIGASDSKVQSTGTSQKGGLCVTDNAETCIKLAGGGEKINACGEKEKGAKVRVFHIYKVDENTLEEIENYFLKLHKNGLTIKVAMHGAGRIPETDESDQELNQQTQREVHTLRNLLCRWKITPEFDETYEKRKDYDVNDGSVVQFSDTPLGAIINEDNSVSFKTDIYGDDLHPVDPSS